MAHSPCKERRASPLPSPRELLRAVGRGRGWGDLFGFAVLDSIAPHPARRLRRRATLPTASRGEGWSPRRRPNAIRKNCGGIDSLGNDRAMPLIAFTRARRAPHACARRWL